METTKENKNFPYFIFYVIPAVILYIVFSYVGILEFAKNQTTTIFSELINYSFILAGFSISVTAFLYETRKEIAKSFAKSSLVFILAGFLMLFYSVLRLSTFMVNSQFTTNMINSSFTLVLLGIVLFTLGTGNLVILTIKLILKK